MKRYRADSPYGISEYTVPDQIMIGRCKTKQTLAPIRWYKSFL